MNIFTSKKQVIFIGMLTARLDKVRQRLSMLMQKRQKMTNDNDIVSALSISRAFLKES